MTSTSQPSSTSGTYSYSKVADSSREAHQCVFLDGKLMGEVWRETVLAVVSKLTEPRRMAKKARWITQTNTTPPITLGRNTRLAMLMGPGFKTKAEAVAVLTAAMLEKE